MRAAGERVAAQMRSGSPAPSGPIPSLDGIRAISVALVFFSHNGLGDVVPGGLGVTIFFVLSGFLITTLMRGEFAESGTVSFRAFYLRRFLRLIPPLLVVTCISVAASLIAGIGSPFTPGGLASVLLYFSNYFQIFHGASSQPPGLGVTWSLAVEEHYYLLYPPLAVALLRLGRPAVSATILAVICALVLGWRCWLMSHGGSTEYLGIATDTRVDAILIGCVLAMLRNPWIEPHRSSRGADLTLAGLCIALLVATLLWRSEFFRFTWRYTLQSTAIAGLLYLAVARAKSWPWRWLNAAPLVYLGTVSYTIYLVHYLMIDWTLARLPPGNPVLVAIVAAALTLSIAELMRRCVEKPCAAVRRRLHHGFAAPVFTSSPPVDRHA
jgi:peptidoglycan/LPS O-acetylase OafA/YrhL